MVHVLVVEDDIRLNQIRLCQFESAGYDARGCTTPWRRLTCCMPTGRTSSFPIS